MWLGTESHKYLCMQMSVEAVKAKLNTHCGTPAGDMKLQLFDGARNLIASLADDQRLLGFYSPEDG